MQSRTAKGWTESSRRTAEECHTHSIPDRVAPGFQVTLHLLLIRCGRVGARLGVLPVVQRTSRCGVHMQGCASGVVLATPQHASFLGYSLCAWLCIRMGDKQFNDGCYAFIMLFLGRTASRFVFDRWRGHGCSSALSKCRFVECCLAFVCVCVRHKGQCDLVFYD